MQAIVMPNRGYIPRFTVYTFIALCLIIAPPFMGTALVSLLNKILIFMLLAMSLDLVFGYAGLWHFGHAGIFGVGAYTTGILIKHFGITSFWLAAPAGIFVAVLAAAIFGFIALRMTTFYFFLITFALGQLIFGLAMQWVDMTGGIDGLPGIPYPDLGFSLSFSPISYYYFTLVIVAVSAVLLYVITKSPFGYSLQGIRESEIRMRCLGYNTWLYKQIALIISGVFAGLAGVLYIYFNGLVTPENTNFATSGLLVFMVIIGGAGTLWGAAIGSALIVSLQYFIGLVTPEHWPLIVGIIFVAAVKFLRGGIFPHLLKLWMKGEQ